MQQHKRAAGLDGLRGAAALTVTLNHFFNLFPPNRWTPVWKYTPLCMLIAGHEAVIVFFLLSGFALHEMVAGAKHFQYWRFALRRVLRIYGPYICALALTVAGNLTLAKGFRPGFSDWFNRKWTLPVAASDVWAHVAFLGDYDTDRFNVVYWSLVHEMRISLIFPVLDRIVRGWRLSWVIGLAVAMMLSGTILNPAIGTPNNIGETLHYAGFFPLGIAIAQRRASIASWYLRLTTRQRAVLAVCAAVLFYYGRGVTRALP